MPNVNPKDKPKEKPKNRLLKERPRLDAIIIAASGEQSYADILRKVKTDEKLSGFGQAVERIRKTQKGELILQLNKSGEDTSAFRELIREDLDEVTTSEDIREAIKNQLQISDIPPEDISLRKAYDSTQIATVRMSAECARNALNVGRLKVGWVNCRLRERVSLTRCFKCLEFGHMARQCTSEVDRSDMCRRCGLKGHIAKDCEREPQCMLCKDTQQDAKHIAGSAASALLEQTIRQRGTDVTLISEPYRGRTENGWIASSCGKAALWALKTLPREVESSQKAYRADTFNTQAFAAAIQSLAITGNVDTMATQMAAQLAEACDGSMARRRPYVRHHVPAYWWNERIASARQACLHARRRYTRSRGRQNFPERQLEYKTARRILKSEIRKSKRECFLELCDTAEYDPWGKAYKTVVKRINAGNQAAPTEARELKRIVETLFPSNPSILNFNVAMKSTDPIEPITTQEILAIARSLKPNKAPGPDGIPNRALRLYPSLHPMVFA
ncbi:hypothetical protein ACLKA6_001109 [Drosophila palustris]